MKYFPLCSLPIKECVTDMKKRLENMADERQLIIEAEKEKVTKWNKDVCGYLHEL